MSDISWKDWSPGLNNGHLTLKEVYSTLPGNDPETISLIVKLLENPESPIPFKGAVSLERHDCIHIILGRGLLPQDEAFVIGYTMGTSKTISEIEQWVFKFFTENIYPDVYKFTKEELKVFDLALHFGKVAETHHIYNFPFEDHMNDTLHDIRKRLKIDLELLKVVYAQEISLVPESSCSKRLTVLAS